MEKFWEIAIKSCGAVAISGVLIYTIYPLILSTQVLSNLDQKYKLAIILAIAMLTFIVAYKIIPSPSSPPKKDSGNRISIENSTINGGVVGGDKHEHK